MNVKEQMQEDLDAVFTIDEFGEPVLINGVEMTAIVEKNIGSKPNDGVRDSGYNFHHVNTEEIILHVRTVEMPQNPVPDSKMSVGDVWFTVVSAETEAGVHAIKLERNI